jgi:hypothetical protein
VLNHLMRVEDGRTPLELARAFQVPKTTLSHTLAAAGESGLDRDEARTPMTGGRNGSGLTEAGRAFREARRSRDLAPDIEELMAQIEAEDVCPARRSPVWLDAIR